MRTSNTYTRHWDVETRQHELLGIDLGEGIPRRALRYGFIFFGLWWGTWLLVAGFPSQSAVPFFLLPPGWLTYAGARRSLRYWRRPNLLVWGVHAQYLLRGVRPVIGRGRIPTRRGGVRIRTRRLGERFRQLPQFPGIGGLFADRGPDPARSTGHPVHIRPRVRLYGPDAVAKSRRRRTTHTPAHSPEKT
ncbi:hypothetical protein [Streptomyces noursei]|uniref:hypothetical protein n=1 Tax=Streptomyces noursei TaxID=1971 RepID=UPI0016747D48|nr:hypothetical protein [Streptomyces noursei]MCZ1021400.1 hypothetical protein [Streptomyces noursei]GGX46207.1 hypothetical protein GCM10010341_79880 [Streptomyces noursei]